MSHQPPRRRKAVGPITGAPDGVEKVALVLKRTYEIERKRFLERQGVGDPSETAVARRVRLRQDSDLTIEDRHNPDNVWRQMARYTLEHQIDPQDWIVKQFEMQQPVPGARVFHPNQLLPKLGAERYRMATQHLPRALEIALHSQASRVQSEIGVSRNDFKSNADCWIYAITSYGAELSALFRYCFAVRCWKLCEDPRFAKFAKRMEKEAALQYMRNAALYDEKWGKEWIPEGFQDKARRIYREEYGG